MEEAGGKGFLYFSNRTANGNIADTSHIPGGYGIYAFDCYEPKPSSGTLKPDMDTLRNVLPLEESCVILNVIPGEDGKSITVLTENNGTLEERHADLETGETSAYVILDESDTSLNEGQSLKDAVLLTSADLGMDDASDQNDLCMILAGNEFVLLDMRGAGSGSGNGSDSKILIKGDLGEFEEFSKYAELDGSSCSSLGSLFRSSIRAAWDGQRLAVSGVPYVKDKDHPAEVLLAVYDSSGREFSGYLKGDLTASVIRQAGKMQDIYSLLGWNTEYEDDWYEEGYEDPIAEDHYINVVHLNFG